MAANNTMLGMDSRTQIEMTADEDSTLLHLSHDLDGCISDLRRNVLESVTTIRSRIHAQSMELIEGERVQRREHERRLLAQIDNLTISLQERDGELARTRLINERLVTKMHKQHTIGATRNLAKKALQAWHTHIVDTKYRKKLGDHLVHVRKERESRQVFFTWRLEAQQIKFGEIKDKIDGEHRRTLAKLSNEHHSSNNAMQLEMLAMKEQLQKEEEHRAILEERLKAAFMRGVCALNMEAMQVLKNTNEAGQENDNYSMASLLQNMNVTAGMPSSGDVTAGGFGAPSTLSNEPGTTERLVQQQQQLQDQLNLNFEQQHAGPHSQHAEPTATVTPQPAFVSAQHQQPAAPHRRPLGNATQHHDANRPGGVVQLNPHYRPSTSGGPVASGQRPLSSAKASGFTTTTRAGSSAPGGRATFRK